MTTIDLSPLYRSSIGFDRLANLLDSAMRGEQSSPGYPPYDIEVVDDNRYAITIAVAGFEEDELNIQVEKNLLTVSARKADKEQKKYLYRGIANRSFERKFNLADYVEVVDAKLTNGLLKIDLVREIPEAMKPRTIAINGNKGQTLEFRKEA
ncbi:Hsp20 family protein [Gynuella sunshinyii]|uniref:Molecular chaperone (Small heat shock protein) n=1 Tax=Gynuella sunshinyii YC6258 TaxID=1445510 RepID=A0A0C5VJK2_9GAMM|nr:Hsp20 family protein [Gynuella sunshinyii]AJQ93578.1 molecular chaperone (small heat shock protein) [Gynuella sunshinyii YC6258]